MKNKKPKFKHNIGDIVLGARPGAEHSYIGYIQDICLEYDCNPQYEYSVKWIYPYYEAETFKYPESDVDRRLKEEMWSIMPILPND
jgi:hypothetical protein